MKFEYSKEKYIHDIEWYSDFDIYLMHLNLNIDLYQIYPEEANIMLYKYYLYIMIEL